MRPHPGKSTGRNFEHIQWLAPHNIDLMGPREMLQVFRGRLTELYCLYRVTIDTGCESYVLLYSRVQYIGF